jgi:site-specific DNA recombinase
LAQEIEGVVGVSYITKPTTAEALFSYRRAAKSIKGLIESEVRSALKAFDPLWNQLFPTEQARIIELLVERVDVRADCVDIKLRIAGVTSLIGELTGNSKTQREAA